MVEPLRWASQPEAWHQFIPFSEGLSDSADLARRGNPFLRGSISGAGTFHCGILHTLPFLIPRYSAALIASIITVAFELLALAWRRG